VTLRLVANLPSLRARTNHRVVLDALVAGARPGFRVIHYSAMTNHMHLVCEAADSRALARGMQGLCVRIARRLNRHWRRCGTVFDDRYHVHHLNTPREVRHALAYVLQNAAHHHIHVSGAYDPCSSAHWFDGWKCPIPSAVLTTCPFPSPRTWLLRVGWRRTGLLDSRAHT
jgi:REP element-mobilizing transposase RayT